jgi:hypothetical protein
MGPTSKNKRFCLFILLHTDCFSRAGINADTAVNAGVGANYRLLFDHAYSLTRALADTRFTTSAFLFIYFGRHLYNPFKNTSLNLSAGNEMLQDCIDITIEISAILNGSRATPLRRNRMWWSLR